MTIAMVGENGFYQGRIHSVGLLLIDKSSKLPTFVSITGMLASFVQDSEQGDA